MDNWKNLVKGTLPIWNGLFNSLIIATFSAILCVYFSTMTAYAIHAYDFKLKKYIYPFILAVMMIPTQVTALGFIKLVNRIGTDGFIHPSYRSNNCSTGYFLLYETVYGEFTAGITD